MSGQEPSLPPMGPTLPAALAFRKNLVCYCEDPTVVVEFLQALHLPYALWENYDDIDARPKPEAEQVLVLPNVDRLLTLQQDKLAKFLQVMRSRDTPFFAAVATVSPGFVPYAHFTPYLKRQFWFACAEPMTGGATDFNEETLPQLRNSLRKVHVHHSIRRYVLDIIMHLRVHRFSSQASGGGCSTHSLRDILELCQTLALAEERAFVVPDIVKTASYWYFPFHLELIQNPSHEISLQYGSDPDLVAQLVNAMQQFSLQRASEIHYPLYFQYMVLRDVLNLVVPAI
ncbi:Maintenance of telomere capping protein 2 [Lachancea thermotolerans]|uniref:Maintenance of telomere capping protein 2 n=1 Tax=Lachancea thermotolerans (strain ATCC 56472 / CBS 6340 / NRRL Y-8284) TaxID=559295 RepID=MTC2_LACTC|nr:KLTH0D05654p [Lachancea thermotolerans CBS 6340]C5DGI8.1 RecName: Full=Maintenance of telomere capping protein 2 [Lachancea thermotolerans CBS 6340]CAR22530.1 KLTH0D05654p [Lachancea thermotolerans CBS 6340]